MKRRWPQRIVEVNSAKRDDPRADPNITQRISRAVLDDALRRTKSGTQRIQRAPGPMPEPKPARERLETLAGPRDSYADSPVVTIMGLESMELPAFDPEVIAARKAVLEAPVVADRPSTVSRIVSRLPISRSTIIVAVLALLAFAVSAGLVGFLVGVSRAR